MLETTDNLDLVLMHRTDKFDTETLMSDLRKIDNAYGLSLKNITDIFDSTKLYTIGDYCIKDNILYKFIEEKSAGEWNDSVIIPTSISNMMKEMNAAITQLNSKNSAHPIGSIYQSTDPTDPSELFGGTWERIQGRFLLAADDTYPAGSTGGEATHTLTVQEMPSHSHSIGYTGAPNGTSTMLLGTGYTGQWDTGTSGNSQPHNNMPPYIAVYMWRRTA